MPNWFAIWTIARSEARLLFRSWAFRIFSLIGLGFLVMMDIAFGAISDGPPHSFRAMAGAMPMMNIKLLNVYQGIIVVFLASEFLKRDRKHDTTQVILTRSFSNIDYYTGKILGILAVFLALNVATLLPAAIIQAFVSKYPFAPIAYIWLTALVSLPTLMFMLGVTLTLTTLLRSQAIVFVIMLGLSLVSLIVVGHKFWFVLDLYAFHIPIMYSDINGMTNLGPLMLARGAYLLLGLAGIATSALVMKRLRQSRIHNLAFGLLALAASLGGICCGYVYLTDRQNDEQFRAELRQLNQSVANLPSSTVTDCDIDLKTTADSISAKVSVNLRNKTSGDQDSVLLSLNPGLVITRATSGSSEIPFSRNQHLVWLKPNGGLKTDQTLTVELDYQGRVDSRYCFLDIDDDRFYGLARIFLFSFPKEYAFVTPEFIHLTPESGWYPTAGLTPGAAYPSGAKIDYARYTLTAELPFDLTAISQGKPETTDGAATRSWKFTPNELLSQISLTAGRYETKTIEVDNITYALYTYPGHDYSVEFLNELGDTLPHLIRDLKIEYELALDLEYPYDWFSLVEAPISFSTYNRYWTMMHETVQPGVVYLSEMGTYNAGADFNRMKRSAKQRQERANQADRPVEIQSTYLQTFVRTDLFGNERNWRAERELEGIESASFILPNFVTFRTFVSSYRWPVLNYAFESYFNNRISVPQNTRDRRWRGLTDTEKANLALQKIPLSELLPNRRIETVIKNAALQMKGQYLLTQMESQLDEYLREFWLSEFLAANETATVTDSALLAHATALTQTDFEPLVDSWYSNTAVPGYWIEDIEAYKVLDGDRVKTQVKFALTNPTEIDGLVEVGFRLQKSEVDFTSWWRANQSQLDYTRIIQMPHESTKRIGVILDQPVQEMSLETYVSRNLPSVVTTHFRDQKLRDNETAWAAEELVEGGISFGAENETLVDNEDEGFSIMTEPNENWLRRTLLETFGEEDAKEQYVGLRFWNPPGRWLATTNQDFYGTYVHSAYFKKKGEGGSSVAWYAELDETAEYDIYYYCTKSQTGNWGRHGNENQDLGKRDFLIYHENGTDDIPLDLNGVEEGWNLLGTYRLLAGENRVEMTDMTSTSIVTADAVKWVKR